MADKDTGAKNLYKFTPQEPASEPAIFIHKPPMHNRLFGSGLLCKAACLGYATPHIYLC